MINSSDSFVAAAAYEHNLVADLAAGNVGDIDDRKIHRYAPQERSALPTQECVTARRQSAIQAVSISSGDHRDACRSRSNVSAVISQRLSRRYIAQGKR